MLKCKGKILVQEGNPLFAEVMEIKAIQYSAEEDCCPVCRYFDGVLFDPLSPEYEEFAPANKYCLNKECRCIPVYTGKDEIGTKPEKVRRPSKQLLETGIPTQEDLDFMNRDEIANKKKEERERKKEARVQVQKRQFEENIEKAISFIDEKQLDKAENILIKAFKIKTVHMYYKIQAIKKLIKKKKYDIAFGFADENYNNELLQMEKLRNMKSKKNDLIYRINICKKNLKELIQLKINILQKKGNIQKALDIFEEKLKLPWNASEYLGMAKTALKAEREDLSKKYCKLGLKINSKHKSLLKFSEKFGIKLKSRDLQLTKKPEVMAKPDESQKRWWEFWK